MSWLFSRMVYKMREREGKIGGEREREKER